jgi:hypothetical protein
MNQRVIAIEVHEYPKNCISCPYYLTMRELFGQMTNDPEGYCGAFGFRNAINHQLDRDFMARRSSMCPLVKRG